MLQKSQEELRVSYRCQEDATVVEVAGELHLPNVERFQEPLNAVVGEFAGPVVLDFRQVYFIDSSGLKALLDVRKQLSLLSRPLTLRLLPGSQPDRVVCTSRMNTIISLVYD